MPPVISLDRWRELSVKQKFTIDCLDLGWFDQLRMADANAVERAVKALAPECQEFEQGRKFWRDIVILPDVGLQKSRMIGHAIEDFRCRKTIACELLQEILRNFTLSAIGFARHCSQPPRPTPGIRIADSLRRLHGLLPSMILVFSADEINAMIQAAGPSAERNDKSTK